MPSRHSGPQIVGCTFARRRSSAARPASNSPTCRRSCPTPMIASSCSGPSSLATSGDLGERVIAVVVAERLDDGAAEEVLAAHDERQRAPRAPAGRLPCAAMARVSAGRTNSDRSLASASISAGSSAGSGWCSNHANATVRKPIVPVGFSALHARRPPSDLVEAGEQRERAIADVLVACGARPRASSGTASSAGARRTSARGLRSRGKSNDPSLSMAALDSQPSGRGRLLSPGRHRTQTRGSRPATRTASAVASFDSVSAPAAGTRPRCSGTPPDTRRCSTTCSTTAVPSRPPTACPPG